jgi:hypothetical protein
MHWSVGSHWRRASLMRGPTWSHTRRLIGDGTRCAALELGLLLEELLGLILGHALGRSKRCTWTDAGSGLGEAAQHWAQY